MMTTRDAYEAKEATHWRTIERSLKQIVDALNADRHEMRVAPVAGYDSLVSCICGETWHIPVYTGDETDPFDPTSDQCERITAAYRAHLPRNTT